MLPKFRQPHDPNWMPVDLHASKFSLVLLKGVWARDYSKLWQGWWVREKQQLAKQKRNNHAKNPHVQWGVRHLAHFLKLFQYSLPSFSHCSHFIAMADCPKSTVMAHISSLPKVIEMHTLVVMMYDVMRLSPCTCHTSWIRTPSYVTQVQCEL